jgi:signal transduction histidine kinase
MRQRAEEIGGRLTTTNTGSGTRVRADLPMEAR